MSQETPPPPDPIDFQSAVKNIRKRRRQNEAEHDREVMNTMLDVLNSTLQANFLIFRLKVKQGLLGLADRLHLRRGQDNHQN